MDCGEIPPSAQVTANTARFGLDGRFAAIGGIVGNGAAVIGPPRMASQGGANTRDGLAHRAAWREVLHAGLWGRE